MGRRREISGLKFLGEIDWRLQGGKYRGGATVSFELVAEGLVSSPSVSAVADMFDVAISRLLTVFEVLRANGGSGNQGKGALQKELVRN